MMPEPPEPQPPVPQPPFPAEGEEWSKWIRGRLFEQRLIFLRGHLDDRAAGQAAAELMTLDASGDDPVNLHVDCGGGTLEAAFTVMDTIDLLGVPVHATCVGRAEGPAVGIVAVAHRRLGAPHARFRFSQPEVSIEGTASDLSNWSRHYEQQQHLFVARIAEATHHAVEHVEADIAAGRYLTAEEALRYGLIDEVLQRGGDVLPFGANRAPFGFRPRP